LSRNCYNLHAMHGIVNRLHRRRHGFSIIELVVVIGIVVLLMGLILPALRSVRTSSHQTVEMNGARQLMVAYVAYANMNRQRVLTGDPQGLNFGVYGQNTQPISGGILDIAKRRYPWRIAPFLSYQIEGLFVNEHRELYDQMRIAKQWDYEYAVSMAPSFGLNTEWLGGDASPMSMGFLDVNHPFKKSGGLYDFNRFYITRITQTLHPSRLIAFASARGSNQVTRKRAKRMR
jgi:type II secretory pathway pseudopilin PulG